MFIFRQHFTCFSYHALFWKKAKTTQQQKTTFNSLTFTISILIKSEDNEGWLWKSNKLNHLIQKVQKFELTFSSHRLTTNICSKFELIFSNTLSVTVEAMTFLSHTWVNCRGDLALPCDTLYVQVLMTLIFAWLLKAEVDRGLKKCQMRGGEGGQKIWRQLILKHFCILPKNAF